MNLRLRTLLAIGLTSVSLTAGTFLISRGPLLKSYLDLERQDALQDAERTANALDSRVQSLNDKITDWAQWDDAYKFMADGNRPFIDSNLKEIWMPVDSILFVDKNGEIWHDRPIQRSADVPAPDTQELRHALKFDRPISERPNQGGRFTGLLQFGKNILNVTVCPITDTPAKATPRGWLVFAQYLNQASLNGLRQQLHLNMRLYPVSGANLSSDCQKAIAGLTPSTAGFVAPLNEDEVASYAYVKDIFGKPMWLIKVVQPRSVYKQGLDGVRRLEMLVIVAGFLFSIVILCVLEVSTLSRVSSLSEQVAKVGHDDVRRVHLRGKDELSRLARKINGMLSKLDESASKIKQSEEQLRVYSEGLENLVAERTHDLAATNAVLANAVEGISRLDEDGNFVSVNAAFANIAGYRREEMIGVNWAAIVHPSDHAHFRKAIHDMQRYGKSELEVAGLRLDESRTYLEIVLIASKDDAGHSLGHYCFAKDISDRKRLEGKIEHQAFHDALTALPNRLLFQDRLERAIGRAKRAGKGVGVIFIDLDNFKVINDSSGHNAGDILLKTIAERMVRSVRTEDTVARFGGDEFAILVEGLECAETIVAIAESLGKAVRQPVRLPKGDVVVTTSIGIACATGEEASAQELLRDADTAMYHAKAAGKAGFAMFDPAMNERAVERMEIEMGLRSAIENGELTLRYQPLVDLRSGKLSSAEALVRWNSPKRGLVSPAQFIPVAEETGLIIPLGVWVLREACRQMKEWMDEGVTNGLSTISVNLSGKQLQRIEIVDQIADILAETKLPPENLKLEITESVLMNDMGDAVSKMHLLRAMGIKLAIDDFGTGYSSMSNLSAFPVDTVKIDQAFVSRLAEEDDAAGVVAAIIMLSKTMKLEVTAEGIEDADQLRYLMALGCNTGQGFYFAKPLDVANLRELWLDVETPAA